jgi:hypothetical protein
MELGNVAVHVDARRHVGRRRWKERVAVSWTQEIYAYHLEERKKKEKKNELCIKRRDGKRGRHSEDERRDGTSELETKKQEQDTCGGKQTDEEHI